VSEQHDERGPASQLEFYVPPDQEAGAYAHTFAIWHTAYDFVIDFALTQRPAAGGP
jgi:hypothetical protein